MSLEQLKATVLEQCLPLLATKPSDQSVELGAMSAPAHRVETVDGLRAYHVEFTFRRLLAATPALISAVEAVAKLPSRTRRREVREERELVGALHVPLYTRRRLEGNTRRSFPVLVSRVVHDTPENRLTLGLIRSVCRVLRAHPFPRSTAEAALSGTHSAKLERLSGYAAFRDVNVAGVRARDISSTRYRVARRLTANDVAYQGILRWFDEWVALSPGLTSDTSTLVDLMLPASNTYWEKVFEVWSLQMVRETLTHAGWVGPTDWSLNTRGSPRPVATVRRSDREVAVYFQTQLPLGQGEWAHDTGKRLRGIPDLTLTSGDLSPMLIDAKWRYQTGDRTPSEEQYKMLGYAENFRNAFDASGFNGVLIFPADRRDTGHLSRGESGQLTTLRTDLSLVDVRRELNVAIDYWLDPPQSVNADVSPDT
ncbi:hypothetical protein ARHIZOSPH14_19550 [Agromyces rhizosphaerae]|uniref:Uncharacterized protein n=1 Tax=Agromyces rhizosphaerae TaxID=88374 RepID=A0A9W6D1D4_9MICO|nr:hypothetical protein [Agromyces rhizosphaerae]GLI27713.1 hypothetical protein ARHIZOSPH14_19550 [Agromyces rhizosphaerae]